MLFYPPLSQLSILFFASAVLLLTIAGLVWRRTATTRVTDWFLVVLVSDAAWALTSIIPLEAGVASVAFAGQASAVAASNVAAVSWVMFSLVYTGRGDVLTRRRLIVLTLPLLLGVGAFATAPFHPLAISDLAVTVRPTATLLTYQLGPLSILPTVYTLSLVSLGTGLVAWTALTDPELYADQTIGLLVGALMPIAGAALTLSGVYDVGNTNITPATLGITAIGTATPSSGRICYRPGRASPYRARISPLSGSPRGFSLLTAVASSWKPTPPPTSSSITLR